MFSRIRKRFTYTNVAMTLALVFAMTGGAYAAKHYIITSTRQISPKVLKQLKGSRGPAGPAGKQGAAGAIAGGVGVRSATLKAGDKNCPAGGSVFAATNATTYTCNGEEGSAGRNGTNGVNGASVTATPVPVGNSSKCNELGGSEFSVGDTTTFACNGESVTMKQLNPGEGGCKQGGEEFTIGGKKGAACNGFEGTEGSPWTDKSVLPEGATETGAYALFTTAAATNERKAVAISFPIKLAASPTTKLVHVGETATAPCTGTVENPGAEAHAAGESPTLCVFEGETVLVHKGGLFAIGVADAAKHVKSGLTGGEILFNTATAPAAAGEPPVEVSAEGTWAVTG